MTGRGTEWGEPIVHQLRNCCAVDQVSFGTRLDYGGTAAICEEWNNGPRETVT
jgi:hypothetical protein